MKRPPRLALLLLRLTLPARLHEAIAGDLEEDWNQAAEPSRLRFWELTLWSIAAVWRSAWTETRRGTAARAAGRGDGTMQSLLQDVRYGLRQLRRTPGFTAAAVATLALGIGVNTAVFSLVNIFTLKPLAYEDPSRVVFVLGWDTDDQSLRFNLALADFADLRRQARTLEQAAAYTYLSANLTGGDLPERAQAYRVTANTFDLLGVGPALGRTFTAAEGQAGRDDVVVLSDGLWRRRFGADGSVVGRRVEINGRSHEIVGVMPPKFEFPVFNFKGDLWVPWPLEDQIVRANPASRASSVIVGRLRPAIPVATAQAEIETIMQTLAARHPETNRGVGARVIEMGRLDDEQAGSALALAMAAVALVLLLACANVANLLLARGAARQRELAVRAAIGAGRWRIARQLLIEALLLALAGGAAGVWLAALGLDALRRTLPEMLLATQPNVAELGVDRLTLGFTLGLAVTTSLLFGLVPAWRAARARVHDALKDGGSTGVARTTHRLRAGLVIAEVALATILLVGAGLLVRSYALLQQVSPGFAPDGVLTMAVSLPEDRYPDAPRIRAFYERALERIQALPAVRAAAFVNVLPFSTYDRSGRFAIDGAPAPEAGREPSAAFRIATAGYFDTLGIPVLSGRSLSPTDDDAAAPVVVVNRALARRHFADEDPLGRRLRIGPPGTPWRTIVGIVGDVHHWELTQRAAPEIYVPLAQAEASMMMLAVRTDVPPETLAGAVAAEIRAVDPAQPVYHVKSMARLLADSLLPQSTSAALVGIFGALALVLACVGVYGVISYGVNQETREFGLRLALGATPRDILRLVVLRGLRLVAIGGTLGLAAGLLAARGIAGALYGVGPADPAACAGAVALLAATAILACAVPAWKASRTDPATTLRFE